MKKFIAAVVFLWAFIASAQQLIQTTPFTRSLLKSADAVDFNAWISNTSYAPLALGVSNALPVLNVKTKGARGDGVTDDTAAVKLALDALKAAGGGTLYFPAGTYKLKKNLEGEYNGCISFTNGVNNVTVLGDGWERSIIKNLDLASNNVSVIYFKHNTNIVIRNIAFDGGWDVRKLSIPDPAPYENEGISFDDSSDILIENVRIYNVGADGLDMDATTNVVVRNVQSWNNGETGFAMTGLRIFMQDCLAHDCGFASSNAADRGGFALGATDGKYRGLSAYGNAPQNFHILQGNGQVIRDIRGWYTNATPTNFLGLTNLNMRCESVGKTLISGFEFENGGGVLLTNFGTNLGLSAWGFVLENGTLQNTWTGIDMFNVTNSRIASVNLSILNGGGPGVSLTGCVGDAIDGCGFNVLSGYGITLTDGGSTRNRIQNNYVEFSGASAINTVNYSTTGSASNQFVGNILPGTVGRIIARESLVANNQCASYIAVGGTNSIIFGNRSPELIFPPNTASNLIAGNFFGTVTGNSDSTNLSHQLWGVNGGGVWVDPSPDRVVYPKDFDFGANCSLDADSPANVAFKGALKEINNAAGTGWFQFYLPSDIGRTSGIVAIPIQWTNTVQCADTFSVRHYWWEAGNYTGHYSGLTLFPIVMTNGINALVFPVAWTNQSDLRMIKVAPNYFGNRTNSGSIWFGPAKVNWIQ